MSSKLTQEEKKRLKEYLSPYLDSRFGFIVRTNAREVDQETFVQRQGF